MKCSRSIFYLKSIIIFLLFCGYRPVERKPNILLIISEDHGQHLSCYGDSVIQTPHLDALADEGVLFYNAYVTQSVCSPSRSSILSGLYPHQNGHLGLATHGYHYVGAVENIYRILKREGYRTGMIGKLHVNPESDFPIDYHPIKDSNFEKRSLKRYSEYARDFINASDAPFFLMVNFPDAHWPFQAQVEQRPLKTVSPDDISVFPYIGWDNKTIRTYVANIYNCILRLDQCIGELVQMLTESGKEDNTLVIYLSDHGDQMARGKYDVYEASNRIPFIVKWPGETQRGMVSESLVSTVDIVPTILDALDLEKSDAMTGSSLLPLLKNPNHRFRKYLFTEKNCDYKESYFPRRAVRDHRFKLIYTLLSDRTNPLATSYLSDLSNPVFMGGPKRKELIGSPVIIKKMYDDWERPAQIQLYDLQNDPWEYNNVSEDPRFLKEKERLFRALKQWQKDTDDPLRFPDKLKLLTIEHDTISTSSNKKNWNYPSYLYGQKGENSRGY